jgi:hypothetical protein
MRQSTGPRSVCVDTVADTYVLDASTGYNAACANDSVQPFGHVCREVCVSFDSVRVIADTVAAEGRVRTVGHVRRQHDGMPSTTAARRHAVRVDDECGWEYEHTGVHIGVSGVHVHDFVVRVQCGAVGICDGTSPVCPLPIVSDGTMCDDGNNCTRGDVCIHGVCLGRYACACNDSTICDDGNACTSDACVNETCNYKTLPPGALCNDMPINLQNEICSMRGYCEVMSTTQQPAFSSTPVASVHPTVGTASMRRPWLSLLCLSLAVTIFHH